MCARNKPMPPLKRPERLLFNIYIFIMPEFSFFNKSFFLSAYYAGPSGKEKLLTKEIIRKCSYAVEHILNCK
jgi:hypothetical protein